jgi:hypothetical protein
VIYLQPANPMLQDICSSIRNQIPLSNYRARRPRPKDHKTWEKLADCMACNLAHVLVTGGKVAYLEVPTSLRNKADAQDYHPALRSKLMKTLLDAFEDRGFIRVLVTAEMFMMTLVEPTDKFKALLNQATITPQDFTHDSQAEVIRLKRHKRIKGEADPFVDYPETKHTRRLRAAMRRINAMLAATDISLTRPIPKRKGAVRSVSNVDVLQRHLRRQFATFDGQPRWDLNGRLYGGFWENMDETDRPALRINGESIADLDFVALHLNLFYHRKGETPPDGDLYAIPGWENYRPGVKKVLNAIINKPGLKQWPDLDGRRGATRELFPTGTKLAAVRDPILAHHPILKAVEKETGFSLTFLESEIIMDALLTLADTGIPALPMHDGLMVQQSKADTAEAVMGLASERVAGVTLQVKRKALI